MGFLTGKTAIITGAGRAVLSDGSCGSIGYGIATAFAKEGANLVITGRNVKKLAEAKNELEAKYGIRVLPVQADVCAGTDNEATVQNVVNQAVDTFGGIQVLVNNAQASASGVPLAEHTTEQFDLALTRRAVETGHDKATLLAVLLHQLGGAVHAERTVMMERHDRRGIQERQAQVLGHQTGGKVLAAAHEFLGGVATGAGALSKGCKLLTNGIGELQLVSDIKIALANVLEQLLTRHVVLNVRVNQVEQVSHLGVALKAATAGRNHHKTAGRIGIDNGLDLLKVFGVGDRRAAKLGNLNHGLEVTFLKASANLFCAL